MTSIVRVKNWDSFQHYKHRNPPWIRLYTRLIDGDSREFDRLKDDIKWQFIAILLLASRQQNAIALDESWIVERLRLRSRLNLKALEDADLIECVRDASEMLAGCKQNVTTEKSRVEKSRTQMRASTGRASTDAFDAFWSAYPRKVGKGAAEKAWSALDGSDRAAALEAVAVFGAAWANATKADIRFCPHPTTWLHVRRWEDDPSEWGPREDYDAATRERDRALVGAHRPKLPRQETPAPAPLPPPPSGGGVWPEVLERLKRNVDERDFATWLMCTRQVGETNGTLRVAVPGPLFREYIPREYGGEIANALEACGVSVPVEYIVGEVA